MKKEIILTRTINAPRERVWKAWTDPKEIKMWWGPDGVTIPTCEIDLRVGGEINIVMLAGPELGSYAGQEWPIGGKFTEIIEPEKIAFINNALDGEGNIILNGMTIVNFEDLGEKTKLTMTTSAEGDGPGVEDMLEGMQPGWEQQLDKLGKLLS